MTKATSGIILAGVMLVCMASVSADPLDGVGWNDCPTDVGGYYVIDLPGQPASCLLFIESTPDDGLGPLKLIFRGGHVRCADQDSMPVQLRYDTAPGGYCKLNGDIRLRTQTIVGDDEDLYEARNGAWTGLGIDSPSAACNATDHWYNSLTPDGSAAAIDVTENPDGSSLFRCQVNGTDTVSGTPAVRTSNDFQIVLLSTTTTMRSDVSYRVSLWVLENGILYDDGVTVTSSSPAGDSWQNGEEVVAVPLPTQ